MSKNPSFLPPPEMLEQYEKISTGFSKKLMETLQREQKHRHAQEKIDAQRKQFHETIGIVLLFIIELWLISGALVLFYYEKHWEAASMLVLGVGAFLLTAFYRQKVGLFAPKKTD